MRFLATLPLLITLLGPSPAVATCCYNKKWLCIATGGQCDPNCADGVSMCDLNTQKCTNDGWGGCIDILFVTETAIAAQAKVTEFQYTATTVSVNSTQTIWTSETTTAIVSTKTLTESSHSDSKSPSAALPSAPSPTSSDSAPLTKRGGIELYPTSTITSTITDPSFCKSLPTSAPIALLGSCTTTITTDSIRWSTTSLTQTTTMTMNTTMTSTVQPTSSKGVAVRLGAEHGGRDVALQAGGLGVAVIVNGLLGWV